MSVVLTELRSPSSHAFDSGMRMVVASRPAGATIEVDRRSFIKNSFVTGSSALLASLLRDLNIVRLWNRITQAVSEQNGPAHGQVVETLAV